MIYGLYLSASGVLANSYRQDVIANNLANAETVGFKRDFSVLSEQPTEARKRGLSPRNHSNPDLEALGGGLSVMPTATDWSDGEAELTGASTDLALSGKGFFAVRDGKDVRLTRDGRLLRRSDGTLVLASNGLEVLDSQLKPIQVDPRKQIDVKEDGRIFQGEQEQQRIGVFDVPDQKQLTKAGRGLFTAPSLERRMTAVDGMVHQGMVERSNVEPTTELTALLDAQRQLEANANMIRYQDQTLNRLVNDVAKIG